MGQVLHLSAVPAPQPLIVFGRALILRLAERTAELTGVPLPDILGPRHTRSFAYARFAVALVAKENGRTLSQIGHVFHDRDHTTILSGVHRARQIEAEDEDFAELVRLLREEAAR